MDKFEYKVRADEIKDLIARGEYAQAAEIADTIDWRRVKSVMMLCTISDLYKINRRYEDARDMLLLAYDRRPGGRTICYSLCELSIKMEEFVQAVEYYKEYVQVAPRDSGRYILQYKLYEAQDVSLEERIEVLEELKKRDYREKWAYELAYLYHRVGLATRCVEECDEMILWFGEGKYVIKAMELKMLHQPLTPEQQEIYDNRFKTEEKEADSEKTNEIVEKSTEVSAANPPEETSAQSGTDTIVFKAVTGRKTGQTVAEQTETDKQLYQHQGSVKEQIKEQKSDALDIHVKTMDVGQYNTINLQAELAAGLREVLGDDNDNIQSSITRSIMAPMMESDTDTLDLPHIEEVSEDDLESEEEQIESSEVFFGETGEISDLGEAERELMEKLLAKDTGELGITPTVPDMTAKIVMEQMSREQKNPLNEEPPKELANVLAQEADGQISLVVPEKENVEKQITGQMSIEDILAEWERMKKANVEKRKEEVRQHVLQQTGTMFTEFEEAVRDGLLEQLESGKIAGEEAIEQAEAIATDKVGKEIQEELTAQEKAVEQAEVTTLDGVGEEIQEELTAQEKAVEQAEVTTLDGVGEEMQEQLTAQEKAVEQAEVTTLDGVGEEIQEQLTAQEEVVTQDELAIYTDTVEDDCVEEQNALEAVDEVIQDFTEIDFAENIAETEDAEDIVLDVEESIGETLNEVAQEAEGQKSESLEEHEKEKLVVVRDKVKIRALTREERELYAPFVQSRSAREQLVQAVDNISLAAYTGNIIITGEEGMDTLTLAKNMIRQVQMEDSNFSGKVAKISANGLNQKDVATIVKDLENGALIILKASEMNAQTAGALNKSLQQENTGIIVVMVDTRKAMNSFLEMYAELHSCFTARMDVEALSNDRLVAFGRQYAREMEYSIDEMGVLALHTRIAEMQTSDHIVTVIEVKRLVDAAIRNVNKKTVGHFFDVLFAKRYDDEDMIILGEKDFA